MADATVVGAPGSAPRRGNSYGNSPVIGDRIDDSSSEVVVLQGTSCVSLLAGQSIVAGSICAAIDEDDLVLTYATTGRWRLYEAQLWAGLSILDMPQTNLGNPKVGLFPFKSESLAGVSSYAFRVPLATFELSSRLEVCDPVTGYIVAHALVKRPLP